MVVFDAMLRIMLNSRKWLARLALACHLALSLPSLATAFAVTGVHAGVDNSTGFRPFRIEISQFQYAGPAWDLYILALAELQQMDQDDPFSYFQLAGIHGYPRLPWDGIVGNGPAPGFCTHSSILFPMWHRPYVALIEQIIWTHAQEIATQYQGIDLEIYKNAAVTMRVPYWDWSLNTTMPDIVSQPSVTVNGPNGSTTIENPLFTYKFHPYTHNLGPDLTTFNTTVRTPNAKTKMSQPSVANSVLDDYAAYFHDQTYLLFTSFTSFQEFSNQAAPNSTQSIENIHGGIHDFVGGVDPNPIGHMTLFPISAFDPIFWLHHANVDRIIAIWQALNPDSFVVPQAATEATYMDPAGVVQDINSPLYPFHADDNGTLHTSKSARYIKTFGYSYPELWDWATNSSAQLTSRVRTIVNQLYHPGFGPNTRHLTATSAAGDARYSAALAATWEWNLLVTADESAFAQPINLELGYASSTDHSNLEKIWELYLTPSRSQMAFPPLRQFPLTAFLLEHMKDLNPFTVLPFLRSSLVWKIDSGSNSSTYADTTDDSGKLAGLRNNATSFQLQVRPVTQPLTADEFPHYGAWRSTPMRVVPDDIQGTSGTFSIPW